MLRHLLLALPPLLLACGGGTVTDLVQDGSTNDAAPERDAAADGATDAAGPIACGKLICNGTDYCVHPCCGGPAPQCLPLPADGGACPSGTTLANCVSGPGCQALPCKPPEPYCSKTTDNCLANGRQVMCLCA
ncbi:hypothetical protein BH09MYX1_BH09MYX1_46830 [soil metagenome]